MNISTKVHTHLTVSIVLYNSPRTLLQRTLQSLYSAAEVAKAAGCLDLVAVDLIDNASTPAYREQLERDVRDWPPSDFFRLRCTLQPRNQGFGHGHNVVLPELASDFHLVLNPDVELQADALREGLATLRRGEDIVLLSPKAFGGNGEQEFLCKRYPSVLVLLLRGFAPAFVRNLFDRRLANYEVRAECSGEQPVNVAIASGCFMLMRTAALRAAGGFNADFFLYFEDFDLSLRLAPLGRLVFYPAMRIVHHGGYAANKGRRHLTYFIRSGVRFFNRHGWRWV
jgi:GT2 family glycosyltransferase